MISKNFNRLLLLLFFPVQLFSQPLTPRFETLGVEDGLSQSSVYSIYQDKKGYMWFGTADGLNRYDGATIKVYKLAEKNLEANSNFVRGRLCEDKNHNIWYANETGIYRYNYLKDAVEAVHFFSEKEYAGWSFEAVYIDSTNRLWLYNRVFGFSAYHIPTKKIELYPKPYETDLRFARGGIHTSEYNNNIYLISSIGEKAFKFNTVTHLYEQLPFERLYYLCIVQHKLLYMVCKEGIDVYTLDYKVAQKISFNALPASILLRDVFLDPFQRIWISTLGNGLYCYDKMQNKMLQYRHDNSKLKSLPIDLGTVFHADRSNNLWIGTDGGGVSRLDLKPSRFHLFPLNEGDYAQLSDYFTKCFYEDQAGNVWFGTHNNGLNIFNASTGQLITYLHKPGDNSTAPGNSIGDIFRDRDGNIWVGGDLGITWFNQQTGKFKQLPLPGDWLLIRNNIFVYRFSPLQNGDMLAATLQGFIVYTKAANGGYKIKSYSKGADKLPITDADEIREGEIWFTSPVNGLYHATITDTGIIYTERFLTNTDLRCIYPDKEDKDIIWVGSGVGLIRFNVKTKSQQVFDNANGMNNSYVYGILGDEEDNLWMSTNGGISIFDKRTGHFTNYTGKDGLQSNEFNTGAYYKGASGNLYFGGIKGFNWFKPGGMNPAAAIPQVAVSEIRVNDSVFAITNEFLQKRVIDLPYYKNDIELQLAALDYSKPTANKLQYQLDGWDKKWVTTYEKIVRYSNLPAGNYTFRVKASNSAGLWSAEEIIRIQIANPFWKTWWFYTLIGMLVVGSIIFLTRNIARRKLKIQLAELKRQQEIYKERQRISREMHDDIGAGLTQITLMSESAKNKTPTGNEQHLEDIADTSRKLVGNMSEIIWSLNPENKTMEQLMAYLREQLNKQLEYSGITYSIQLPENGKEIVLSNEQRRNILMVTKEIVNNAIKYSKAKNLSVKTILQDNKLYFEVKDDGVGFDPEAKRSGNGLMNIRHRIEVLNGMLNIESRPVQGSRITFTVPLQRTT